MNPVLWDRLCSSTDTRHGTYDNPTTVYDVTSRLPNSIHTFSYTIFDLIILLCVPLIYIMYIAQNILTVGIWFKFQKKCLKRKTEPDIKENVRHMSLCYDATGPHDDKKNNNKINVVTRNIISPRRFWTAITRWVDTTQVKRYRMCFDVGYRVY